MLACHILRVTTQCKVWWAPAYWPHLDILPHDACVCVHWLQLKHCYGWARGDTTCAVRSIALMTGRFRTTSVYIGLDERLTTIDPLFRPFSFDRPSYFLSCSHRILFILRPGIRTLVAGSISLIMVSLSASLPPSILVRIGTPKISTRKSYRQILKLFGCRILSPSLSETPTGRKPRCRCYAFDELHMHLERALLPLIAGL